VNRISLAIIFTLLSFASYSQSNFSINTSSLGYCFKNSNTHLYSNYAFNNLSIPKDFGVILSYDTYIINDVFSAKLIQSFILDRANKNLGFSAISVNQRLLKSYKHQINIYAGFSILYRQTWNTDSSYVDNENFISKNKTQIKNYQFVSGLEYAYQISNKIDFLTSVIYYQSNTLNLSFGFKYWISKKYKKKRECISCPNMH
jgi:hypothetical protein